MSLPGVMFFCVATSVVDLDNFFPHVPQFAQAVDLQLVGFANCLQDLDPGVGRL